MIRRNEKAKPQHVTRRLVTPCVQDTLDVRASGPAYDACAFVR